MCVHSRLILEDNLSITCASCGKPWACEGIADLDGRETNAFIEI